ncbi:MAG TPA: SPOR domain-containing protein [Candidatus Binataceae bacterium]|nr:SPOR domain-containing protein [Candidatus Binataceae bacterium]
MRFEIGPGGGFVILVGLLGLSAAVFFLGMISGREMAESEQGQSQLASVYPMPADAPAASPPQVAAPAAPIAAATPKPSARAAVASETMPPAAPPKPTLAPKAPPRPTLASVPRRPPSGPAAEEPDVDSSTPSDQAGTGAEGGAGSARPPSAGTHHGYNIVIDAAMDRAAANRMASRLLGLGYTSHIVPTRISGQTWYRVQVGPYPTSGEARAAQAQLRTAYTARYINHTAAASSAAAGAGSSNTGDSGAANTDSDDSGGGDSAPSD